MQGVLDDRPDWVGSIVVYTKRAVIVDPGDTETIRVGSPEKSITLRAAKKPDEGQVRDTHLEEKTEGRVVEDRWVEIAGPFPGRIALGNDEHR